jgi:excisionase family DNA binding protein
VGRYSHAGVPAKRFEDDFPLGRWVEYQRSRYREGKLADDRRRTLERTPGWLWDRRDGYEVKARHKLGAYVEIGKKRYTTSDWDEVLTVKEVAALLGISEQYVRQLYRGRKIPGGFNFSPRTIRFLRGPVEEWVEKRGHDACDVGM